MERARTSAGGPVLPGSGYRILGYASLFGVTDQSRDVVERGAFAASLAQRGATGIRMLWQHDPAEPVGVWESLREDARGLFVTGRLAEGSARAREIAALMAEGAVDGLSIGFRTIRARRDPTGGPRRLLEVDLWEISVVTFPMQDAARARLEAADGLPPRAAMQGPPSLADEMREAARRLLA